MICSHAHLVPHAGGAFDDLFGIDKRSFWFHLLHLRTSLLPLLHISLVRVQEHGFGGPGHISQLAGWKATFDCEEGGREGERGREKKVMMMVVCLLLPMFSSPPGHSP